MKPFGYYCVVLGLTAGWCVALTATPSTYRSLSEGALGFPVAGMYAFLLAGGLITGRICRRLPRQYAGPLCLAVITLALGWFCSVALYSLIVGFVVLAPIFLTFGLIGSGDAILQGWYCTAPMSLFCGLVLSQCLRSMESMNAVKQPLENPDRSVTLDSVS